MSWAELENGDLISAAEGAGFEVMVTGDKDLAYQQNLAGRKLSLIVLGTNNWNIIKEDMEPVVAAVNDAKPGGFRRVAFTNHSKPQPRPSIEP
jgi:hypothetical protein